MIAQLTAARVDRGPRHVRLEVRFDSAPGTIEPLSWSYEVDDPTAAVADLSVLPALPGAYVLACRLSQDLHVVEPLPPALHEGARAVGAQLAAWYGWRPAELIAPIAPEPLRRRRGGGRGLFFTRGVDSWATLLEQRSGPRADRPTHLVAVDGDAHLDGTARRAAIEGTRAVADALGLPLIVVRTDVRAALDQHTDWGADTHGSVLAGIGLLLRSTLRRITISPTNQGDLLRSWGSHPQLEPRWSLPELEVVHHSSPTARWQRLEAIAADPLVASSLQVCWQGGTDRNCGRCDKCLRTRTSLEIAGAQDCFAARFDAPWDPDLISQLAAAFGQGWCDTLDHCDQAGLTADPLRQRWEEVPRSPVRGEPTAQRPVQPRLPIWCDHADLAAVGRHLARLGLRVDHRRPAAGPPALRVERGGPGGRALHAKALAGTTTGPEVPLAELRIEHLEPLLEALAVDTAQLVPFPSHRRSPVVGPAHRR